MKTDGARAVVSIRLAGYEDFALGQLADMMSLTRSAALRRSMTVAMRDLMVSHPHWPMHPAWATAGKDDAARDHWTVTMFPHWAWAVTAEDPGEYLQKVRLDGVTAFRLRQGGPVPKLAGWAKHVEAHWERKAEKFMAARAAEQRKADKAARRPVKARKPRAGKVRSKRARK